MSCFRWFSSYLYKVKGIFFVSVILMFIETLCLTSLTYLQKFLIDDVFINKKTDSFSGIIFLMIGSIVIFCTMLFITPVVSNKTITIMHRVLQSDFMRIVFKIPVKNIQEKRNMQIVHYFLEDIPRVSGMVEQLARGIQKLFSVILSIAIVFSTNSYFLAFLLILGVLYIIVGRKLGRKVKKFSKNVENSKANLMVKLEEGISSTREVLSYNRIQWEQERYDHAFGEYFSLVMVRGRIANHVMYFVDPIKWGAILVVLAYGGFLVYNDIISIGSFVIVYQFSSTLLNSMNVLFQTYVDIQKEWSSVERLKDFIDAEIQQRTVNPSILDEGIDSITFVNVDFSYSSDSTKILNKLSFSIPCRKKVAFVGKSGCGKSTIAQLLIKFREPMDGKILINGHNMRSISTEVWMKTVGIVFQEPYLFPDTIRNNLLMGLDVSEEEFQSICRDILIEEFVCQLPDGYETIIGERGTTLSGGQRQRIALARALFHDPEILILDEATSSLDVETEREIQFQIDKRRNGKTTIIIAHRMSTILNSDLIYVVDDGAIVEMGDHTDLIECDGVYKKLLGLKNSAY